MSNYKAIFLICFILILSVVAVAQMDRINPEKINKAIAVLYPTAGNSVSGVVTFAQTDSGILIIADVDSLKPGLHGFHIHQWGDCNSASAQTAGDHFNPEEKPHGAPTDIMRHVGDLGNLQADSNGVAHLEFVDKLVSFSGSHSIIGHSVVIHANADDFKTQPSGNAGPRVACGVIGIAH